MKYEKRNGSIGAALINGALRTRNVEMDLAISAAQSVQSAQSVVRNILCFVGCASALCQ